MAADEHFLLDASDHGRPDRTGLALYEAALGHRVRRATYVKRAEV